jgi:hypothetical protein
MVGRILAGLLLATLITFSCREDDDPKDITAEERETESDTVALKLDSNFQHCDSVYIATRIGTACCINGPTVAKSGDILRYHYQMNHRDAKVDWQILEGDISIISGQGMRTVTVQFGPNFTTGIIIGVGVGIKYENIPQLCSDRVIVDLD